MDDRKIFERHFYLLEKERALYAKWLKTQDCTVAYFQVLEYLAEAQGRMETGIVADALTIPRQTMTSLLDVMEKDGVLIRQRVPADRRKVYISLTVHGEEKHALLTQKMWQLEERIFKNISREKMEIFNAVYEQIIAEIAPLFDKDSKGF